VNPGRPETRTASFEPAGKPVRSRTSGRFWKTGASFVHGVTPGSRPRAIHFATTSGRVGELANWIVVGALLDDQSDQAAPAMYRATRPHVRHLSVTWDRGGGGNCPGLRSIGPEHDGQLSGEPVRSFAIRFNACAGLYVAGRGLRITPSSTANSTGRRRRRFAETK
jgi:hypothetical protein